MESNILWKPDKNTIENSNILKFINHINDKYNLSIEDYEEFYNWSVKNFINFWNDLLAYSNIKYNGSSETIQIKNPNGNPNDLLNYKWFPDLKLNFAENLLRNKNDTIALEYHNEDEEVQTITYNELFEQTANLQKALIQAGVQKNDRIAGYINNGFEAVIAMLATTSIGAIWSSTSPDFGSNGVIDRFKQIKPKILFAVNGYKYNGKKYDKADTVNEIASKIPEIEKIIVIEKIATNTKIFKSINWNDFNEHKADSIKFEQLDFNHPVYIMYSSGTTGLPKSIVHGAGGTLLQHYKELVMHTDLKENDKIAYFTTTGWMMWNWLISSLMTGATVVLIDGSPSYPDLNRLWNMIQDNKITIFGTSPKFLSACEKNQICPNEFDLSKLKAILSTGAPLTSANFQWVYNNVKEDVRLSSISGGTDIISCFMLGTPMKPVYNEEIQTRGLGMMVEAWDNNGNSLIGEKGELVCTRPFPSMPVYFWNDENNSKYRNAYFEDFEGIWKHGDYIKITDNGGVIVYGRSDATLNPGGIRIGTAEIYRVVEAMEEITDSIAVGKNSGEDTEIVLFIKLSGNHKLNDTLINKIKNTIKQELTPRHIPKHIIQVKDIPHTINGKKVEIAVTKIINGKEIKNKSSIANPECLDEYKNIKI